MVGKRRKRIFRRSSIEGARALLPWYLNGSLSGADRSAVEAWLQDDPAGGADLASWQRVAEGVARQGQHAPPPAVWQRVRAQVQDSPVRRQGWRLAYLAWGTALAVAVLLVLWAILQPGIELAWSVDSGSPAAFRVYRAPIGSADFGLLGEVPATPDVQAYSYVDARLWPARTYVYRVEAVADGGQAAGSQAVTVNARDALPGQVAILFASLCVAIAAVAVAQRWRLAAWNLGGLLS